MPLRQLRAVAMKEQRRDRDVSNGVYLYLAKELFQERSATGSRYYTALVTDKRHLLEYLNGSGLFRNLVHHNGK